MRQYRPPSVDFFRHRAAELKRDYQRKESAAHQRVTDGLQGKKVRNPYQTAVAIEAGFASWAELTGAPEIERLLVIVMVQYRELNSEGLGLPPGANGNDPVRQRRRLERNRAQLRHSVGDVSWTVQWLRTHIEVSPIFNLQDTSGTLKSLAEASSPQHYLSNGVMVAAALICCLPICPNGTPKPNLGITSASVERVRRLRRAA